MFLLKGTKSRKVTCGVIRSLGMTFIASALVINCGDAGDRDDSTREVAQTGVSYRCEGNGVIYKYTEGASDSWIRCEANSRCTANFISNPQSDAEAKEAFCPTTGFIGEKTQYAFECANDTVVETTNSVEAKGCWIGTSCGTGTPLSLSLRETTDINGNVIDDREQLMRHAVTQLCTGIQQTPYNAGDKLTCYENQNFTQLYDAGGRLIETVYYDGTTPGIAGTATGEMKQMGQEFKIEMGEFYKETGTVAEGNRQVYKASQQLFFYVDPKRGHSCRVSA